MSNPTFRSKSLPVALALLALATFVPPQLATASSHMEAPQISMDNAADNTDVYAFVPPERKNGI